MSTDRESDALAYVRGLRLRKDYKYGKEYLLHLTLGSPEPVPMISEGVALRIRERIQDILAPRVGKATGKETP